MSDKFVWSEKTSHRYAYFDLLLSFNQLCGLAFVILSGYLFNTMEIGIKWPSEGDNGGINFHGMFMSTGLVFFQGEALLSHRMYRYDNKVLSKFIHTVFHLLAMGFFSTALAAMILQKNANVRSSIPVFTLLKGTKKRLRQKIRISVDDIKRKASQILDQTTKIYSRIELEKKSIEKRPRRKLCCRNLSLKERVEVVEGRGMPSKQ
ncbi:unnamed protein product [Angiostrongylus costaricensis]|uniref:Cytochrome b561 domain-containing protein n=1 Tax=Angiostrongylus costaricensis TaxID=334426 RepID=A0A0R3PCK8_ANGCS|nr:unnamed protein product [Angiostrongylus costaricensis]